MSCAASAWAAATHLVSRVREDVVVQQGLVVDANRGEHEHDNKSRAVLTSRAVQADGMSRLVRGDLEDHRQLLPRRREQQIVQERQSSLVDVL
eukprot:scaffold459_cov249-Pinguiococcus_pyrenoidosus.AAC.13